MSERPAWSKKNVAARKASVQPDEVGEHEHSADEPAAPHAQRARAPPLEDLKRPRVERRRDLGGILRVDERLDRAHLRWYTPPGARPTACCRISTPLVARAVRPTLASPERTPGFSEATSMRRMPAMNEWTACSRRFRPKAELSTRPVRAGYGSAHSTPSRADTRIGVSTECPRPRRAAQKRR